jgi:hypothetical protein
MYSLYSSLSEIELKSVFSTEDFATRGLRAKVGLNLDLIVDWELVVVWEGFWMTFRNF